MKKSLIYNFLYVLAIAIIIPVGMENHIFFLAGVALGAIDVVVIKNRYPNGLSLMAKMSIGFDFILVVITGMLAAFRFW
ncbi:MAG TPA: hypothetical protein PLK76_02190 [bacterium]|nr:hypothetical protein [bacterium]